MGVGLGGGGGGVRKMEPRGDVGEKGGLSSDLLPWQHNVAM